MPRPPEHTHRQAGFAVRLDWALPGARAVALDVEAAVVVDVLSFTTSVTVAVERGIRVLPYRWNDETAPAYAEAHGAVLALGRRAGPEGAPSLSPHSLLTCEGVEAVLLPSPNGSTICLELAESVPVVVAGSLRNATAVAARISAQIAEGGSVALVPAGERWPDGSLRLAVEDLWGAGAVVAGCLDHGVDAGRLSPEAEAAAASYRAVAGRLPHLLSACASGQELIAGGFGRDVALAAELDISTVVPALTRRYFTADPPLGDA